MLRSPSPGWEAVGWGSPLSAVLSSPKPEGQRTMLRKQADRFLTRLCMNCIARLITWMFLYTRLCHRNTAISCLQKTKYSLHIFLTRFWISALPARSRSSMVFFKVFRCSRSSSFCHWEMTAVARVWERTEGESPMRIESERWQKQCVKKRGSVPAEWGQRARRREKRVPEEVGGDQRVKVPADGGWEAIGQKGRGYQDRDTADHKTIIPHWDLLFPSAPPCWAMSAASPWLPAGQVQLSGPPVCAQPVMNNSQCNLMLRLLPLVICANSPSVPQPQ